MSKIRLKGLILLFLFSAIVGLSACLGQSRESVRAITVSPTSLTTSEDGSTATFTVALNEAPAGNVVIDVVSSDTTEALVSDSATGGFAAFLTLTFTQTNWSTAQTVTVQGVDDAEVDGNQNVTLAVTVNTSLTQDTTGYLGINPPDVSVTNIDDDTVGVTVTPTTLATTEAGDMANFTVRLNTPPDNDVVIDVTSSDTTEGIVGPSQLTFTPTNWSTTQTVTVTGVDDVISDGNQTYTVTVDIDAGLTTDTTGYATINPADVTVTNNDNDTSGVTVTPTTGLMTNESGSTATFTVVLNTVPDGDVVIDIASSNVLEGTVSPAQLTFTPADSSTPQTVTVTGVDDTVPTQDGPQTYIVTVDINAGSTTDTTGYAAVNPADVTVINTDNDTAGVTVNPATLTTNEAAGAGHTATFTVVLNTAPTSDVNIDIASTDLTEGTVSPAQLTFTDLDWSTAQTVTVTGVADGITDGNQTYTVTLVMNPSTSATGYSPAELDPADVTVTNNDNDAAGVTVTPTSLTTNEAAGAGHTATFSVVLNTTPVSNVIIDVASTDLTEGTVNPAQLTFTPADSSTPQTVTVTGVDDLTSDGNQTYTVTVSMNGATSATGYTAVDPADVTVTNVDNDVAGVSVTPTSLTTNEAAGAGHTATFSVVLNTMPDSNVIIDVASTDLTEGTVSPAQLTFTDLNWSTAQTVTVTGVDDAASDGNQTYTVTLAMNSSTIATGYAGLDPADVTVTNNDNDAAGVSVTPTSLTTNEAAGAGHTATFSVVLNTIPDSNVIIDVASTDLTEGTVSPAQLTFTPADSSTPQTVTVTGVADGISDGNQTYAVTVTMNGATTATGYTAVDPADVSVTNNDNDAAGVTVTPTSLTTNEAAGAGHTATFSVVLNTIPDSNVIIDVASLDLTEGTVSPAQLTFTPADSSTPQTVTVTGVADGISDGNQTYTVTVTMNGATVATGYAAVDPADVSVTNNDNDAAGVTVTPTSLTTNEAAGAGHTATFDVVLNTTPDSNVIIDIASLDLTEGTVSPAQLTFTPANPSTPQTVTVTGVADGITDGNQTYTVTVTMNGSTAATGYTAVDPADVTVTNNDNDAAGVTVNPTSGLTTTEAGGTANFTVVLNTQPDSNVIIDIASSDGTEGSVSPTQITFPPGGGLNPQTVTVTGQDDFSIDGNQGYTAIVTMNGTTAATGYAGLDPADVSVTNTDNDTAGVTVTPTSGLITTEALGTDTFTVVLNTIPNGNVVIGVDSDTPTEGTAAPASLTFTSGDWQTPQTVTVTGVDDIVVDGDIAYTIVLTTDTVLTTDNNYDVVNPDDVGATNLDND